MVLINMVMPNQLSSETGIGEFSGCGSSEEGMRQLPIAKDLQGIKETVRVSSVKTEILVSFIYCCICLEQSKRQAGTRQVLVNGWNLYQRQCRGAQKTGTAEEEKEDLMKDAIKLLGMSISISRLHLWGELPGVN